jgi:hypothetical protein
VETLVKKRIKFARLNGSAWLESGSGARDESLSVRATLLSLDRRNGYLSHIADREIVRSVVRQPHKLGNLHRGDGAKQNRCQNPEDEIPSHSQMNPLRVNWVAQLM